MPKTTDGKCSACSIINHDLNESQGEGAFPYRAPPVSNPDGEVLGLAHIHDPDASYQAEDNNLTHTPSRPGSLNIVKPTFLA